MSITYPEPQRASPYPKAVLGPTPELRAKAAIDEAISHFRAVARSGGMIGIFLIISLDGIAKVDINWIIALAVAVGLLSVSLSLSAVDFRLASQRPKFHSGLRENDQKFDVFHWLRLAALIGAFVGGIVCLFWYREIGLSRIDGKFLFYALMIASQLVVILMETIQGIKLLRFAHGQTLSEEVAEQ